MTHQPNNAENNPTGNTYELLKLALFTDDHFQYASAVELLGNQSGSQCDLDLLIATAHEGIPESRRRSLKMLGQLSFPGTNVAPILVNFLRDSVWPVREACVYSLSCFANQSEVSDALLRCILHDKNELVRQAAVRVSRETHQHNDKAIQHLLKALVEGKPPVRCRAAVALAQFRHVQPDVLKPLANQLVESHSRVRIALLTAIGMFQGAAISELPEVARRLYEGDQRVRLAASKTVCSIIRHSNTWLRDVLQPLKQYNRKPEQILRSIISNDSLPNAVKIEYVELCRKRISNWTNRIGTIPRELGIGTSPLVATYAVTSVAKHLKYSKPNSEFAWLTIELVRLCVSNIESQNDVEANQ